MREKNHHMRNWMTRDMGGKEIMSQAMFLRVSLSGKVEDNKVTVFDF